MDVKRAVRRPIPRHAGTKQPHLDPHRCVTTSNRRFGPFPDRFRLYNRAATDVVRRCSDFQPRSRRPNSRFRRFILRWGESHPRRRSGKLPARARKHRHHDEKLAATSENLGASIRTVVTTASTSLHHHLPLLPLRRRRLLLSNHHFYVVKPTPICWLLSRPWRTFGRPTPPVHAIMRTFRLATRQ